MKQKLLTAAAAVLLCMTAPLPVCAAGTSGTAYIFLHDAAEDGVRYEGPDAEVNTIEDGVTTAAIDADGSYTVSFDLSRETGCEVIDEISALKLYVIGPPTAFNATVRIDSVKINGEEIALTAAPQICMADNVFHADLCDADGDALLNHTDYIRDITSAEIRFTVSDWITETITPALPAPAPSRRMLAKSPPSETAASQTYTSETSDPRSLSILAAALAGAALIGLATYRKS